MALNIRQLEILDLAKASGRVAVEELAQHLSLIHI